MRPTTTSDLDRPWQRMIRDLHRGFDSLEREMRLLREIDERILAFDESKSEIDEDHSFEHLFAKFLGEFAFIHRVPNSAACYVNLGKEQELLCAPGEARGFVPPRISFPPELLEQVSWREMPEEGFIVLRRESGNPIFRDFPEQETALVCPMYMKPLSEDLLCTFMFFDSEPSFASQLSEPNFGRSVAALVRQLAIAYVHSEQARRQHWSAELWNSFLGLNLSPTPCFNLLVRRIPNLLPNLGPLKLLGAPPQVQILTVARDAQRTPQHLTIRGTTGREANGTRIALERSICGLVVENAPFFHDDPTKPEYAARYRSYLGGDEAIRTEFVAPLKTSGNLVGVLNLETPVLNAFNVHHERALLSAAETIAPLVSVFEEQLDLTSRTQQSVASSTQQYLVALAGVFNHGINTLLLTIDSNVDLGGKLASKLAAKAGQGPAPAPPADDTLDELVAAQGRIHEGYSQVWKYKEDFCSDIKSYGETGLLQLKDILQSAIELANGSLLAKRSLLEPRFKPRGDIVIALEGEEKLQNATAYCSTLLKQHLFSIFSNAVFSIEDRMVTDPAPGKIVVSVREDKPVSTQEVSLNQSWVISIRDNGTGVAPEVLDGLRRFEPGFHRRDNGHGYGLSATQRYIGSIGGRVELDSEPGKYFEVSLYLAKTAPTEVQ